MSSHAEDQRKAIDAAETAERARRIAAMFERWNAEDVSSEPDWDPDAVAPLHLEPGKLGDRSTPAK